MSNVKNRTTTTVAVYGREFEVEEIEWKDSDGLSFDVSDKKTGLALHNESFDDHPGEDGIAELLDQLDTALHDGDLDDDLFDGEDEVVLRGILRGLQRETRVATA